MESGLRRMTGGLRVLPDFVILGTQRGGTTSLFHHLSEHPNVASASRKEVHYFDLAYGRGERWYRSHFPTRTWAWLHGKLRAPVLRVGEASPYYLFHPAVPERLKAVLPDARLIVLLRNPVDRAISHFYHERRRGREPLSLEQALEEEQRRLEGAPEALAAGAIEYAGPHHRHAYLSRGLYAEQLERWFRFFPRNRFLVLRSEDFYREPAPVFREVLGFLDLPPWEPPGFSSLNAGSYPGISEALRSKLQEFFAPHNRRLYDLLDRDFGWNLG